MADKKDDATKTFLPDDDSLITFISDQPEPPKIKEIARAFNIKAEGRSALRQRLRQLAESGKLKSLEGRRLSTPDQLPPVTVVEITAITADGEAVAEPVDTPAHPVSIIMVADRRKGKAVAVGDRVLARLTRLEPDQYQGQIIRQLDRHQQRLFGLVFRKADGFGVEPVDRGARAPLVLLPLPPEVTVADGDMVEVEAMRSSGYGPKKAKLVRNLGPADAPGAFSALAIAEFGLRHAFDEKTLAEADKSRKPVLGKREDLRATPLVTIDGADARDFDDAVFAMPLDDGGHRLIVAIADVAHYVAPDSALDREARKRGNSVYLPDQVLPMLPEALSNGLCSLVPGEDRACLAVEIEIGPDGGKRHHRFLRGLMKSHARLTYDAVEDYRTGADTEPPAGLPAAVLDNLFATYDVLAAARRQRGALELDLPEKRVAFDDAGKAVAITRKRQSVSQKLIEEFMILANVCAAESLEAAQMLCVFRAHDRPDTEKIDALQDMVKEMGLSFPKGQVVKPAHFNRLLATAAEKREAGDLALLNETVLRCQSQANYQITNPGHFGLALRRYAHFTSPIRRYADLMVHRQIINLITPGEGGPEPETNDAAETAKSISETERQAAAAERRTTDRYAASLIKGCEGDIVDGIVRTITGFGAFVEIEDSGIEGLLPLGRLPQDYYEADPLRGEIRGRSTGLKIKAGDSISVMVIEVAALKATVTLAWAGGDGYSIMAPGRNTGKPRKHRGGKAPGKAGKRAKSHRKGKNKRR